MFENVLSKEAIKVVDTFSPMLGNFYLAGGTGLSLQLGHRKSEDMDFFSGELFNTEVLLSKIKPEHTLYVTEGTVHCELKGIKLSFLFYKQPLIYPTIIWHEIKIAEWRDIVAEKFKAISQRGSKKDFYDLYAVLKQKLSIEETCQIFKERFSASGLNKYHVLKSIVFFEDAEDDPAPIILMAGREWEWESVKNFFEKNISRFEKELL
jgi:hypothetical protein